MEISQIDIHTILPQQQPFVMIDKLLQCDTLITRTEFLVQKDNLFFQNGALIESGIVENIAQTCAARMGYINSFLIGKGVRVGFIGSIKNLIINNLPKEGDLLETKIEVQSEVFNITLVNARVCVDKELIAECEMKISEQ